MNTAPRILFGFCGDLPDDLERYQGLMEFARPAGWSVHGIHEHFERTLTRLVRAGAVDGVIAEFVGDAWLGDLPERVAVVHAGRRAISRRVSSASLDGAAIGRAAAAHLKEQGYGELACWSPMPDAAVESAFGPGTVFRNESGLMERLRQDDAPLGLYCTADPLARQALQLASRLGVEVPDRLGVVGTGDRYWDAALSERRISSIPLPQRRLGHEAARLLEERLSGAPPRALSLSPDPLLPRESSLRLPPESSLPSRLRALYLPNLAAPHNLDDIARRLGMSRRSLEIAHKKLTGTSPYQHLLQLRLDEAKRLLRETDWTLVRVGEAVGFPDPSRFSTFFKSRAGMSPGAWRAQGSSR